jgi:hypothetical protein
VQLDDPLEPLARLGNQRRRPCHVRMLAEAERPGHEKARDRVGRPEHVPVAAVVPDLDHLAVAREVALDLPGDALGHPDLAHVDGVAELPRDAVGEGAGIEVVGRWKSCSAFVAYPTFPRMRDSRKTRRAPRSCEYPTR